MDLPMDNEPLQLADGTMIDCTSGKVIRDDPAKFVSVPSPSEAQRIIAKTKMTVSELPLPPKQLSAVAMVAFYTLYGLSDRDISVALEGKITEEQIEHIRTLDAYVEFMATAKQNMLNTESQQVRDLFEQHAHHAAQKIISLSQSDAEVLAFKASQDVLDRAGHRPADVVEHRHKMEDALHIVVIKKDETKPVPTIDIDAEVVNG
jgi:hypothetical protein